MAFTLPELPYSYDALAPHIDARTMEIHHSKHHAGYVTKLNNALDGSHAADQDLETILGNVSEHGTAIRNNGGGVWNHNLYWKTMTPDGGGEPKGEVGDAINATFDSYDNFKEQFTNAALGRFGSGWAWLVVRDGKLEIGSTPNQDNPLMDVSEFKGHPILGIDVWEHAYYLNYQNRRPDYVSAWWNLINWDEVNRLYHQAK